MSTRSMTVILDDGYGSRGTVLNLYRHCDGYPAEAGYAIVRALRGARDINDVAVRLLRERYTDTPFDTRVYRLADWPPEAQGDLEHVYVIRHDSADGWRVLHAQRGAGASDDWRQWSAIDMDLKSFRAMVKRERGSG